MLQFLHSVSKLGLGREGKLLKQTDQLNTRRRQIAALKETECEVKVYSSQVPLECMLVAILLSSPPGKVPSLSQGFLLEMMWEGDGGGDQRIMKISLHRLPTRVSFSLFVITATNRFGHVEQAAILPFLSRVHCGGFGTWVPVSPLSKALFLFLSLSCSTGLHVKEQKSSSSSLVG